MAGNFGGVLDVRIPRPITNDKGKIDSKASESVENLGKVFVMFETLDACTVALRALAGRQFGGTSVFFSFEVSPRTENCDLSK